MTRSLPFLMLIAIAAALALPACASYPEKYSSKKIPLCGQSFRDKTGGVPYNREASDSCVSAMSPFDVSAWIEAPMNSHRRRSIPTVQLGCKPISVPADNCDTCGLQGHSNTLMMNFDPSVFDGDVTVQKATLAVYSPDSPDGLSAAQLRGRLSVGDELQSLARSRTGVVKTGSRNSGGWVFFDVTNFVGRAINERRNSIHFEVALPCQTPATNLVTVGVTQKEPRLVVEYR